MEADKFAEMTTLNAEYFLRSRDDARRYMEEAVSAGRKRDAILWRARLRRLEKIIAQYELHRSDQPRRQ
jgi:hypothetical protein